MQRHGLILGRFISTGTQGGGQESTALAAMSTLTHHGFIYVPLGYKTAFCKHPSTSHRYPKY
jgi:NAD(P)H dehydrogenase (quinone)